MGIIEFQYNASLKWLNRAIWAREMHKQYGGLWYKNYMRRSALAWKERRKEIITQQIKLTDVKCTKYIA